MSRMKTKETTNKTNERINKSKEVRKMASTWVLCAKEIRRRLKTSFPATKFSVTSEYMSYSSVVRIKWEYGPSESEVHNTTNEYCRGVFNLNNDDSYVYTNRRDDIPQVDYITCDRIEYFN